MIYVTTQNIVRDTSSPLDISMITAITKIVYGS